MKKSSFATISEIEDRAQIQVNTMMTVRNIIAKVKAKRSNKMIAVATAIVLGSALTFGAVSYGHSGDPAKHMEKRIEHMKKNLGLSDQQITQMRAVFEQNKAKLMADKQAVKNATDANKAAAKAQFKADRTAVMTQMNAVLTPDQQKKLQDWEAKHHDKEKKDGDKKD